MLEWPLHFKYTMVLQWNLSSGDTSIFQRELPHHVCPFYTNCLMYGSEWTSPDQRSLLIKVSFENQFYCTVLFFICVIYRNNQCANIPLVLTNCLWAWIYNYGMNIHSCKQHSPTCTICLTVDSTAPDHTGVWAQSLCMQEASVHCKRAMALIIHASRLLPWRASHGINYACKQTPSMASELQGARGFTGHLSTFYCVWP